MCENGGVKNKRAPADGESDRASGLKNKTKHANERITFRCSNNELFFFCMCTFYCPFYKLDFDACCPE